MRNLLRFIVSNYFVLLFLFLEGLAFLFIIQSNAFQHSRFMSFSRNLTGAVYDKMQGVRSFTSLRKQNELLLAENAELRAKIGSSPDVIYVFTPDTLQNDTVSESGRSRFTFIPARVINNSITNQYNYLTLNKGSFDGVEREMGVISQNGVAGIVLDVTGNFSTVISVLNRNFRVSAKIKRNGYFGIVEWDGLQPGYVKLREIPNHIGLVNGDTILTSGHSEIFPEGIPVGTVESFAASEGNYYDIKVKLFTDFGNLHYVTLIGDRKRFEQNELERRNGYD
jgi:rod shape-determining protein MreC